MEVKDPAISTPTEIRTATICKEATLAGCHRGDDKEKDRSSTNAVEYPWDPSVHYITLETFDLRKMDEMVNRRYALVAKSLPNDIIIPDPTPKKIFLDTTRLLAAKTNNLVDEVWNYLKTDKLVEATVLLLAAQREIRKTCISKGIGNDKHNGFYIIMYRISKYSMSLRRLKHDSEVAQKQVKEKMSLMDRAWQVVRIITHAGEALDKYIRAHSEVPQVEVLEHVSSILKEYGFCSKGECIDITNLRPYDCNISDGKLDEEGNGDGSNASTEASYAHAAVEKAMKKKIPRGWDPTYTRRSYFPYWRSVLGVQCNVRVYPSYAAEAENQHRCYGNNSIGKGSSSFQSRNSLSGRIQQLTNNYQSRRFLHTGASTLFKMLKIA